MPTYLLAGGGTAGHVNPLLALADEIRATEPESSVVVLGTQEGLEARLVPERGYELVTIDRLPFPRRPNAYALRFPARYLRAVRKTRALLRDRGVDVVVGFGGYASAPAYRAAKAEGIPSVIHEANALPGMANKLGARSTTFVGVTFPGTPIAHATVTGMPLRREISQLDRAERRQEALDFFGLDPRRTTLLVTGGSLGAQRINEAVSGAAAELVSRGAQVLHIWGGLTEMHDPGVAHYHVMPYCDRMYLAIAAADLVVSRAGSTTVSELTGLRVPAIYVPYAHGNGEQRVNAAAAVQAGAALLVNDSEFDTQRVLTQVAELLSNEAQLNEMSERARPIAFLDGTERLHSLVRSALEGNAPE